MSPAGSGSTTRPARSCRTCCGPVPRSRSARAASLTLHDPSASPIDPATCTDVAARLEEPYLLWAPGMPDGRFQRPPGDLDGHGLIELALELFGG